MTAKGTLDVYRGHSCYITIANFGMVDLHLQKHQIVDGIAHVPVDIVHIKNEQY